MSFLFETLPKWDRTKGFKAFSYFNLVAKHWYIQRYKSNKKKTKSDIYFDKTIIDKIEKEESSTKESSFENKIIDAEFYELLKEEVKKWRLKFEKKQEKLVIESVILLLSNPDLISIYNKKAIYLYLREITGLNTKQIVTNLVKFKKKYDQFKAKYDARRFIIWQKKDSKKQILSKLATNFGNNLSKIELRYCRNIKNLGAFCREAQTDMPYPGDTLVKSAELLIKQSAQILEFLKMIKKDEKEDNSLSDEELQKISEELKAK